LTSLRSNRSLRVLAQGIPLFRHEGHLTTQFYLAYTKPYG
jgi:hypothetical protein